MSKSELRASLLAVAVVGMVGCGDDRSPTVKVVDAAAVPDAPATDGSTDMTARLAGIGVTPTRGLRTTERGAQGTFTVVLESPPAADVTIALESSDLAEGKVSPTHVTFTSLNWNAPQVVTVTGQDDSRKDGDVIYRIITAPATSTDARYAGLNAADVEVTNIDDESAGVLVTAAAALQTTEAGGQATFIVALTSRPTASVTIDLTSSDAGEGTVSPASLTFTPDDWNAAHLVTITGVNDSEADGPQDYMITLGAAVSLDANYTGAHGAAVAVINIDDDSAGITVARGATPILTTTEQGGQATFTVVLNSQPSSDVTIGLASSDTTEGTVSPASLTFTSANWSSPRVVTVTGVDDSVADGNQLYSVLTAAATSADPGYAGSDAADVAITNTDNDSPGVTVTAALALTTTEAGGQSHFTIVLNSQPTAAVTIPLSSSDLTEGRVNPSTLTFTPLNWDAPQTVTATGVNDALADGNQPYSIVTGAASGGGYDGIDAPDVSLTNIDDETAGITVTAAVGLTTTEGGGQATFTIVLNSEPTADVTIGLTSSDPAEGTVSPASVTFTALNWNAPQTVMVAGVNDDVADGNQPYSIVTAAATSGDAKYSALNAADVSLTNTDNDSAGIAVTAAPALATTEAGGQATFTIVLSSRPTVAVTIGLTSSDAAEGTVSPASVTFTALNWNAPQTVTVAGVNDDVADGNQPYSIVTAAATSGDPGYNGLDAANVSLTNIDNDSAGITVTAALALATTEGGGQAMFTIALRSQPTVDVTIGLTSSDTTEGTVSPTSVTFTALNWNAPQTVTVTGVNDDVADGNQPFSVMTAAATSGDSSYSGMDAVDVSLTNTDNDSAGIMVAAGTALRTTEDGGQATFTIALRSQPTANVTLGLTSSNLAEGTVSPASVTFTALNWNAPQTVTVTGVNDDAADGNQPYSIVTAVATSGDPAYGGLDAVDVSLTNTDNDSAGFAVAASPALRTTEVGGQATFTIALRSQPTANVTVGLTSSDTTEGTVSPASVTFTALNWNAPQTVTVTGVNDDVADGNQPYSIVMAAATSGDSGYSGLDGADVLLTNIDNDSAGIAVIAASALATTEAGGQATFTIVLSSRPAFAVTIGLTSSDTTEGTVSPASVTFTALNWNAPQIVTVTGVNDDVADGNQPYSIVTGAAISGDPGYNGLDAANVSLTNTDNDSAGITVTAGVALTTTEAGGQATFTIALRSQPTASVTIGLTSSDAAEGTVSPGMVTFTALNWNAPQTVTVTGVNDDVADGNQPYSIVTAAATSGDPGYSGMDAADVSLTNTDNDSAGITVTAGAALTTTEAGGQATFTIALRSQPTASVTIGLTSSNTAEGTVSPASVTFTALNWNAPQTVTVTGANDDVADGNQPYSIVTATATSGDPGYNGIDAADVSLTNNDNDSAGITVTAALALATTEGGGQATFTVVLRSQPTANVTIGLTSSDTTEGTVSPASVMFTALNWNAPQTVTVTGVNDDVADGNQPYSIVTAVATSGDPGYNGIDAADVSLTNNDNDSAAITVTAAVALTTTEGGGQATFTIVLTSQPTDDVTIGLTSSNTAEGTVSPASVTFTSVNWNAAQTVTVTGVNDDVADGNQPYSIVTAAATSGDAGYSGMDAADVSVTNTDNDSAGITVTAAVGLTTTEAGGTATFTVVLTSQPTGDVIVPLTSSATTEGTVSASALTFTSVNWSMPQTVTVTGVDDSMRDGDQPYTIVTAPAMSGDSGYVGRDAADVSLTNTDDDSPGITVTPTTGLITTEAGGTATFTVVLRVVPLADVTIGVTSSNTAEGTVAPASLTFTTVNWSTPQTVTATGVNDAVHDGNQAYTIVTGVAVSVDSGYGGLDAADVSVSNTDDDSAGITVTAGTLTTSEAGGTATFTVVLRSQPTADVSIPLSSSDTTEGTVSPASLTFTSANWSIAQTVTLTGVADGGVNDGPQIYTVIIGPATSTDPDYSGLDPTDLSATNIESSVSCKAMLADLPATSSGSYPLDPDGVGAIPGFTGYCDMTTDGGGWTLLGWVKNNNVGNKGVPFPGLVYCSTLDCARGSAVPPAAVNALLALSTDFGGGESANLNQKTTFGLLGSYQYAARYRYSSLATLTVDYGAGTCSALLAGTMHSLVGFVIADTPVVLGQGLRVSAGWGTGDFSSDSVGYTWSAGMTGLTQCSNSTSTRSTMQGTGGLRLGPNGIDSPGVQGFSIWVR